MCQFIDPVVFIAVLCTAAVTGQQDTLADAGLLRDEGTVLTECCKMLRTNRMTPSAQSLRHPR
jgi:hypothetical protein